MGTNKTVTIPVVTVGQAYLEGLKNVSRMKNVSGLTDEKDSIFYDTESTRKQ